MTAAKRLLASSILLTVLTFITGCSPQASNEIKPGVALQHQPKNAAELMTARSELIKLIKAGKITVGEARQFLRTQKKRLGLPNPGMTRGFDQLLQNEGLT